MRCENCGRLIPKARRQALPETRTCVRCSAVHKVKEEFYGRCSVGELFRLADQGHHVNCPLLGLEGHTLRLF